MANKIIKAPVAQDPRTVSILSISKDFASFSRVTALIWPWRQTTASLLGIFEVNRFKLTVLNFFFVIFFFRVVEMDFYGRNDIALGGFLERYCFHTQYACPSASCQAPMAAHVRRFVHDTSSILVIIRQLANPVNSNTAPSVSVDRSILMWSWCKKCKQVID